MYLADRVKETSTTTGTGALTLAGAVSSYFTFASAFAQDQRFLYTIESGASAEVGVGYLDGSGQLVRDRVLRSTNANAPVNLAAGTHNVFAQGLAAATAVDVGRAQAASRFRRL